MFKTNLKIAWRNLLKDRQFTLLNVLGLAAGLACSVFIYLWVADEMSYDKFFANNNQVYQLMEHRTAAGQSSGTSDESSGMLGEALKFLDAPQHEDDPWHHEHSPWPRWPNRDAALAGSDFREGAYWPGARGHLERDRHVDRGRRDD